MNHWALVKVEREGWCQCRGLYLREGMNVCVCVNAYAYAYAHVYVYA